MRVARRALTAAFGVVCLALAACGGRGSAIPPNPAQMPPNGQFVRDALGAAIPSGGDAVWIAPRTLGGDQRVAVSRAAQPVSAAPNPAWLMLGGTLDVRFERALPASRSTAAALRLTLAYAPERAPEILAADMPVVVVTYRDGTTAPLGLPGSFDAARDRVSVEVPGALAGGAVEMRLGLAVDNPLYTLPPPGPRYWNGHAWTRHGTLDPHKRTLVFIHGIFSSVESAFPNPCTPAILKAGGYAQAVGWDYNWTNPPQVEGPKFAAFLNGLHDAKLASFDVEAHSYGSVVTYAAVPSVGQQIAHVVTLGGPLPLRGSPLARGHLLRLVLVTLAQIFVGPPSLIEHAYRSGMVKSLATNGKEMRAILAAIRGMTYDPDFVDVAGTKQYPAERVLYPVLYFYITYPWDGIVEKIAANSTDVPNTFPGSFHKQHTELECASDVIAYVGSHVRQQAEHLRPVAR